MKKQILKKKLLCLFAVLIIGTGCLAHAEDVNVCFYMIGGDLEHDSGAGSADILEILRSKAPENVHIFLLTGGADDWRIPELSGGTSFSVLRKQEEERFELDETEIWEDCEITEGETLKRFLDKSAEAVPGAETMLVLWGHGGMGVSGIGDAYGHMLTLNEIRQALTGTKARISVVGMDACAMATLESGWLLADTAEILIASTGTEAVSGWPHQLWLPMVGSGAKKNVGQIAETIGRSLARKTEGVSILTMDLSGFRERNKQMLLNLFLRISFPGNRKLLSTLTETAEDDYLIGNWDEGSYEGAKDLKDIGEKYMQWMMNGNQKKEGISK